MDLISAPSHWNYTNDHDHKLFQTSATKIIHPRPNRSAFAQAGPAVLLLASCILGLHKVTLLDKVVSLNRNDIVSTINRIKTQKQALLTSLGQISSDPGAVPGSLNVYFPVDNPANQIQQLLQH